MRERVSAHGVHRDQEADERVGASRSLSHLGAVLLLILALSLLLWVAVIRLCIALWFFLSG